jgi:hypothetical protein
MPLIYAFTSVIVSGRSAAGRGATQPDQSRDLPSAPAPGPTGHPALVAAGRTVGRHAGPGPQRWPRVPAQSGQRPILHYPDGFSRFKLGQPTGRPGSLRGGLWGLPECVRLLRTGNRFRRGAFTGSGPATSVLGRAGSGDTGSPPGQGTRRRAGLPLEFERSGSRIQPGHEWQHP